MRGKRVVCAMVLAGQASLGGAQTIPWDGEPYFVSSRNTPLSVVLKNLGANYGLPVVVSQRIVATYAGQLEDKPRGRVLTSLSKLYQLLPYYDGRTLYIYEAQEMDQALITPSWLGAGTLEGLLAKSGLLDSVACQLNRVGSAHALQLTGVPVCLARVTALAKKLDEQNLNLEQDKESVEVFPLKYANAADTNYSYRSQNVVVPGVVTVLRDMLKSQPLVADAKAAPAADSRVVPSISADPRLNAVLVRDLRKNMSVYTELIAKLDTRPSLIEISVAIIDVDAADLSQLGVDWSASAQIGGGSVSFNASSGLNPDTFSSLVANAGSFQTKLTALEQQSRAKVISRPSVVTLDNVQAVLDRNVTFYTKLQSKDNPQLASISTGELMRVTPRLLEENGQDKVFLTLNIQDGRQAPPANDVENLPQVQNAEIATQATLNSGQALLLGGFVQDELSLGERRIPLLGNIPIIGGLFRSKSKTARSVVRLFLIKAEPKGF